MSFKTAIFDQPAQVSLGGCFGETEGFDNVLCSYLCFIGHKYQDIDQFLGKRGLYRPFIDHSLDKVRFIDHFNRSDILVDVISQMGSMQLGHVIEEYVYILILSGVYQSLNIFALILF